MSNPFARSSWYQARGRRCPHYESDRSLLRLYHHDADQPSAIPAKDVGGPPMQPVSLECSHRSAERASNVASSKKRYECKGKVVPSNGKSVS